MPHRNSFSDLIGRYDKQFFMATGFTLVSLLQIGAILVVAAVGIVFTTRYIDARKSGEPLGIAAIEPKWVTSEERFVDAFKLPSDFSQRPHAERISILQSKIESGEALSISGGRYAQRATDQLVLIYGTLCQEQDAMGIDSEKAYASLSAISQEALATGNEKRSAEANFIQALSATKRLNRHFERTDFRFATDTVLNLDRKKLVHVSKLNELYDYATDLHDNSSKQDSTAIFLSILADKLIGSPSSEISSLGLNLKDHPRYGGYHAAVDKQPYTSPESKLEFFGEMLSEIEKAPPQSPRTYKVIVRLIDRLTNVADAEFAGGLTERLAKAASLISPKIKASVDRSIQSIETRIATLGKTLDLSGGNSRGEALQLTNDKPTALVFWNAANPESIEQVESLINSDRFDLHETNVLLADIQEHSKEQLSKAKEEWGHITILDNETSRRLGLEIGIELVPYLVLLDENAKVISLGEPTN